MPCCPPQRSTSGQWSGRGSNPQPQHCERCALPIELPPHRSRPEQNSRADSVTFSYSRALGQPCQKGPRARRKWQFQLRFVCHGLGSCCAARFDSRLSWAARLKKSRSIYCPACPINPGVRGFAGHHPSPRFAAAPLPPGIERSCSAISSCQRQHHYFSRRFWFTTWHHRQARLARSRSTTSSR